MSTRPTVWLITFITEDFLLPGNIPCHPPMAGLYIATSFRKAGWEPKVMHLVPGHVDDLCKWLDEYRPDMVGFSTLTGPGLSAALAASRRARELNITVIWGGVHTTLMPEKCLRKAADYVVTGEGDETALELGKALIEGKDVGNIPGVAYIKNDEYIQGPPRGVVKNLDDNTPAWDLIDPSDYVYPSPEGSQISILFSRGCPYRCRFCYNQSIRAGKWRRHSDEYLADTIDNLLGRAKFTSILFNDDFLMESIDKRASWVDVVVKRGLKWAASFRPSAITPEMAKWLEEKGCSRVRLGMDSGYDDTLEVLAKKTTIEDHYNAMHALKKTSINVTASFVINWPRETRESITATLRLADEFSRMNPRFWFSIGFYIPLPGNPIYDMAVEDGFREPEGFDVWDDIFNHPFVLRGFSKGEKETLDLIYNRLYDNSITPWPLEKLFKPAMRWRWRNGMFKWFAPGAARKLVKALRK